mgnify:CR=1 FL=1
MNKTWYTSKAIWGAIFLAVAGVAQAFGIVIPDVAYTLAGALGIYGVRDAIKQ